MPHAALCRGLTAVVGAATALVLWATPAVAELRVVNPSDPADVRTVDANLDIQPDATGDPFFAHVQACLNELKAFPMKAVVIQKLVASANVHTIERTGAGSNNRTSPPVADESNGTGTGSQTFWNPLNNHFPTYADGTPRDPCAALLHELVHAEDKDAGVMDRTRIDTTDGVPPDRVALSEVRACQAQNWLHQEKNMPSRRAYGGQALPLGIQFDRCPDGICIFAGDGLGTISYPVTDVTLVVYEVPVAGHDPSPVPGMEVEIKDGLGTTVARATLVKQLDGRLVIRLRAEGVDSVAINGILFKNDGQDLTPTPTELDPPLVSGPTVPEANSVPIQPPAVPSLNVVKGPDDTTIAPGGMITFTIRVTNKGTVAVSNVVVVDPAFPACNFTVASLPPGATEERTCTVTVGASSFVNQVQVTARSPGATMQDVGPVVDVARVIVN